MCYQMFSAYSLVWYSSIIAFGSFNYGVFINKSANIHFPYKNCKHVIVLKTILSAICRKEKAHQ